MPPPAPMPGGRPPTRAVCGRWRVAGQRDAQWVRASSAGRPAACGDPARQPGKPVHQRAPCQPRERQRPRPSQRVRPHSPRLCDPEAEPHLLRGAAPLSVSVTPHTAPLTSHKDGPLTAGTRARTPRLQTPRASADCSPGADRRAPVVRLPDEPRSLAASTQRL